MFKFLIAAAAVAVLATPVAAQRRDVVSANPNALYCAENVPVEGTPYVKRVCKTRAEWIKRFGVDPVALVAKRHEIKS